MRRLALTATFWTLALLPGGGGAAAEVDFEREVAPILLRRCVECHAEAVASGGLVLTTREKLLAGGESGAVIQAGQPAESSLWQRVRDGEMPPLKQGKPQPLPAEEVAVLERWIAAKAPWPEGRKLDVYEATNASRAGRNWWSLQPVKRPPVPAAIPELGRQPIDAFIAQRLGAESFIPAPEANRPTLIRRLYVDVLGLPPTYEEIERFVADPAPDAWEQLVDRVLASPLYGERWARHWLDVVRFAETSGYERDQEKPFAWKYRDYVVEALNTDKPFDRFIIEQLSGDEIPDRTNESVIATGFLRFGTWNDEPNDPEDYLYERLEDLVHTTSTAFLGLTVKCARCHDHKFDPIPQVDYYRMASAFWGGPLALRDRAHVGGPTPDELGVKDVLGWTDLGPQPSPLKVLKNGDRHHPQQEVTAASLSFQPQRFHTFDPPTADAKTTGRRRQLAAWIADRDNPLTARVAVNRLWQHHFGQALVRSPDNFGFHGDQPSHPELLDWLAAEFLERGWRSKPLHRLILTSGTYRLASAGHPLFEEHMQRDAGNRLRWQFNRRRLDAEALRDALLTAAGDLDLRLGGPSFRPSITPEALEGLSRKAAAWNASPLEEQRRRSLYGYTQRSLLPPFMTAFDFGDTTLPCGQREVTTVAPQALALLNDDFVHQCSQRMAERIRSAVGAEVDTQITEAWRIAYGRDPQPTERTAAQRHLTAQRERFLVTQSQDADRYALSSLCHVLLNANEFLYVD